MLVATNSLPSKSLRQAAPIKAASTRFSPQLKAIADDLSVIGSPLTNNETTLTTGEPITVKIAGKVLTRSLVSTPAINQYYFDYSTRTLTVNLGYNAPSVVVYQRSPNNAPRSLQVKYIPPILKQYRITGEISFRTSFNGHPSASFQINAYPSDENGIRAAFTRGTPLTINGIGYRVRSLSKTQNLRTGETLFQVDLQGYWESWGDSIRSPLDRPVRVRSLLLGNECEGFSYNVGAVASAVGVNLSGIAFSVKVPRSVTDSETVTLRALLSGDRLLAIGCYVRWESPNGPEIRRWDSPQIWPIFDSDLASESLTYNEPGMGASFDGIQLVSELSGASLELQQDPNGGTPGDKRDTVTTGDKDPTEPHKEWKGSYYEAFNTDNLKSLNWCFDIGDKTKKTQTRSQLNGSDLESTELTYGWVYTSADVYDWRNSVDPDGNPIVIYVFKGAELNATWQVVREVKYKYEYDSEGYFQRKTVSGKQLTRALKETADGKEAIKIVAAIAAETDPNNLTELYQLLNGYTQWFWQPVTGVEDYNLDSLASYYKDLRKKDPNQSDYVTPRFARERTEQEDSAMTVKDPRSTRAEPQPDLILGAKRRDYTQTTINSTSPEKYLLWNPVQNQEGTNFEESASSETFTENVGRPPVHTRLAKSLDCHHAKEPKDEDKPQVKYLASTPGALSSDIAPQTLSYTGAYTLDEATLAARTDYQIKNTQSALTVTLPLGRDRANILPGDAVLWRGTIWRVMGCDRSWEIAGKVVNLQQCELSLGKDVRLGISVNTVYS